MAKELRTMLEIWHTLDWCSISIGVQARRDSLKKKEKGSARLQNLHDTSIGAMFC